MVLEGMLLKPNIVVPGLACLKQPPVDRVADATVECLFRVEIWRGAAANVPASTASPLSSSQVQPCRAPWRIQRRDGREPLSQGLWADGGSTSENFGLGWSANSGTSDLRHVTNRNR
ncbi:MAG: class I fructose-bisphosphate aldolase [Limisphaerales bacterium]